jgi:hypothetical protein
MANGEQYNYVTDPELLAALESGSDSGDDYVTNPELLAFLEEGGDAPAPKPEPKRELTGGDLARGRGTALLEGGLFGWGDEAAAGAATLMAKLAGDEKGWGEIYDDIYGVEQARQQEYKEARPGEALAAEIAGGVTTGGLGMSRALGTQAVKNLPKFNRALAASGVGATEGAVIGAGAAGPGNRMEGAKTGAMWGAALPLALAGGGEVGHKLIKERDINKGLVGELYRDVVAEAFGGGAIREGAKEAVDAAEGQVKRLSRAAKAIKDRDTRVIKRSEQAMRQNMEESVEATNAAFRQRAYDVATPERLPPEVRAEIAELSPQEVVDTLQQHWTKYGFSEAKQRNFALDRKEFKRRISGLFDDDPGLRQASKGYVDALMSDFDAVFTPNTAGRNPYKLPGVATGKKATVGTMKGDELMELRNTYARAANRTSDGQQRTAFRRVANAIDGMITAQLDGEALTRYQDDMARWEGFSTLHSAVGKASTRKGGAFTPDEWLSAIKGYKLAGGKGVLQDTATQAQTQGKHLKKSLQAKIKDNPLKARRAKTQKQIADRMSQGKKQVKELKDLAPTGRPSLFKKSLATIMLGAPLAPVLGPAALPVGYGIAKTLASKHGQRFMGGQAALQRGARNLGDRYYNSAVSDILRNAPGRAAAMQAGQEE